MILVSRFSALGDVAMTVPSVYDACRAYPQERFLFITRPHAAKLFVNAPENLTVKGVDLERYDGIAGLARLKRDLEFEFGKMERYVDLHDVLRTKVLRVLFALSGTKCAHIRKGRASRRALTRKHRKVLLPLRTTFEKYRDTFRRAGLEGPERFRGIYESVPADEALFAAVSEPKGKGEKWYGVAPFAKHRGKIYPPEKMEEVVAGLAGRSGAKVFLFGGGPKESAVLAEWAGRYPAAVNVASAGLGLDAELALLARCDAVVSMDSANMHLASLAGTRVVSVWGATHPYCGFAGWRQREEDRVQLDVVCRPCSVFGNKPCSRGDYICLEGISPQRILAALDSKK